MARLGMSMCVCPRGSLHRTQRILRYQPDLQTSVDSKCIGSDPRGEYKIPGHQDMQVRVAEK